MCDVVRWLKAVSAKHHRLSALVATPEKHSGFSRQAVGKFGNNPSVFRMDPF